MELTKQERELIQLVRVLSFDDLLDAMSAIYASEDEAKIKVLQNKEIGNLNNVEGFRKRAENLNRLAVTLGEANADYRYHTNPDDGMNFSISVREDMAARFEDLASHLRDGWQIDKIEDNVGNDSCYYFTLIRSEHE